MNDFWTSLLSAASVPALTVMALIAVACFGERRVGP